MSVVSTSGRTEDGPFSKLVEKEWQTLLEKDDRTSPAEYPDMCLIERNELAWAMAEAWIGARGNVVRADLINLILAEEGVQRSEYLAVKIAVAIEAAQSSEVSASKPDSSHSTGGEGR